MNKSDLSEKIVYSGLHLTFIYMAALATSYVLAPGFRGEDRARDYVPTLAVMADGTPWVAWDNSHKASLG